MKGFKKLALVAAISAAPFAQAELTSIDDSVLGDVTGQAGISIELSANVSIGSIEYTDTDGFGGGAGSLGINNIVLGGDGGGALDKIKIDIDVDATAGLVIHLGGTNTADVLTGGADRVDFGLTVDDVVLNNSATLASNISIGGNLGPIDVIIANDGTIGVDAYFEVTSGSLDVDVLGLGISNLTIGDDSAPITTGAYGATMTSVQALAVGSNAALITATGDQAADDYAVSLGYADEAALRAAGDPTEIATLDANRTGGEDAATSAVEAGAIAGVSNMAYVGMTIAATTTGYLDTTTFTQVVVTNALNITIDAMAMDIGMDLTMGNDGTSDLSLGSVAINDLDLSGTSLTIYGH